MMDKIKNQIDNNKKDREEYKEYIDAFVKTDKIKELFSDNDEFKNLTGSTNDKEDDDKNEDEFF